MTRRWLEFRTKTSSQPCYIVPHKMSSVLPIYSDLETLSYLVPIWILFWRCQRFRIRRDRLTQITFKFYWNYFFHSDRIPCTSSQKDNICSSQSYGWPTLLSKPINCKINSECSFSSLFLSLHHTSREKQKAINYCRLMFTDKNYLNCIYVLLIWWYVW